MRCAAHGREGCCVCNSVRVLEQALASASAFNLAPASLRASSFRANKDAAVSAKPAFAVAPKARSGRAASVRFWFALPRIQIVGCSLTRVFARSNVELKVWLW